MWLVHDPARSYPYIPDDIAIINAAANAYKAHTAARGAAV
jgi:hypothetical protein